MRVVLATADLGLGGTAKGLVSIATRLDRRQFDVRVVSFGVGGPRVADLERADVPFALVAPDALADAFVGADVVHVYRHGISEPLVPGACVRADVPVLIESNIFGAYDRSADERRFDCHLMISEMCLMRYRARHGGAADFDVRHRVHYLPVESASLRAAAVPRDEACRALGLDPARPVVARVGRATDLKWRDLLVDMVPHLVARVPDAQIVFVGATEAKRARLTRLGVLGHVRLIEPVTDEASLAMIYSACDVVVNAAVIGESQGVALAEALTLGIPVVTCSTPWVDNAQIEFVKSGETGWVANHPREFAEAVADLLSDDTRRRRFGAAGQALVDRTLDPELLARRCEALYRHHRYDEPLDWEPSAADLAHFAVGYAERSDRSFRPLTKRERIEARIQRERETVTRHSASLRMIAARARARVRR
jgi:glycosyltransferase involved in cell wall biosynthesis